MAGQGTTVQNGDYGHYWGATLGLTICDAETGQCPIPPDYAPVVDDWIPNSYGLTKLSFNITGAAPNVRLTVQTIDGTQYCRDVQYTSSVLLSTLTAECWSPGGEHYAGQPITGIMWQIPTNEVVPTNFDFCLEDIRLE